MHIFVSQIDIAAFEWGLLQLSPARLHLFDNDIMQSISTRVMEQNEGIQFCQCCEKLVGAEWLLSILWPKSKYVTLCNTGVQLLTVYKTGASTNILKSMQKISETTVVTQAVTNSSNLTNI